MTLPKPSLRVVLASLCLAALPVTGLAQTGNPVANALKGTLRGSASKMTAAAEKMPADKYSFRPTAGSRTFGELVLHIANSNGAMCHWLSGAAPAGKINLTAASPKAQLVDALRKSFAYCSSALQNFSDSDLSKQVDFFGGHKVSAAALVLSLTDDWADHYSQEAAYLRRNGMLPPTAHGGQP